MRKMSQTQLAKKVGVSKSAISMYESGRREPSFEILETIADALNASFYDLIGKSEHDYLYGTSSQKPLLGVIHCGDPVLCEENIDGYITIPDGIVCDYALRCEGDSMIDAGINDGDIVYVQQQPDAENGQIVVAMVGDETTLKRFYRAGDSVTLMPANSKYAPIMLSGETLSDLRILGRAVGFTRWI